MYKSVKASLGLDVLNIVKILGDIQ